MIKYLLISFSFLLISPEVRAHGEKVPVVIRGMITDVESGKILYGAEISLEVNGEIIHSTRSNEKGYFQIQYDGAYLRTDNLRVSVYKSGYRLQKIKPLNNQKENLKIELQKRPKLYPLVIPAYSQPAYNI